MPRLKKSDLEKVKLPKTVQGRVPDNVHIKMIPASKLSPTAKPKATWDWVGLFSSWVAAQQRTQRLTLQEWCAQNDLADKYPTVMKNFREISRQVAGDRLSLCAPNAAERLAGLIESPDDELALKASTAVLDRTGYSPQQVQVTLNQNTVNAVVIPPLLKEDYSREIKSFIDAAEARDDE